MCGIAGIIDSNYSLTSNDFLEQFSQYNKFRGPDAFGLQSGRFDEKNFYGLAHHRLSIIDLQDSANQPMSKGSWQIIFNGEIYNFRELRKDLIQSGSKFHTNSDTEVILELLQKNEPEETFKKLNGMFAIAILNKDSGTLYLARDRWGKKPLYYYRNNNHISFSSDIRSFSHLPYKFHINEDGLRYYFSELSFPQPQTIFNEILQVDPGYCIKYRNSKIEYIKYIDLYQETINHPNYKTEDPQKRVKNLLSDAIESRLQADVPVGAFLSGGIDSGLIVSLSKQFTENLNTFTVGFEDSKFDERQFANLVAKKYNTQHHELIVNSNDIDIEKLILEFGEPFADSSMIPSYLISKIVSKHQKVVLSGDGGDELFCGNKTYIQAYKFDNLKNKINQIKSLVPILEKIPIAQLKKLISLQNNPKLFCAREMNRNLGFKENEISALFNSDINFSLIESFEQKIDETDYNENELFKTIYYGCIRTRLLNDYLVKIDRASMFASLEIRSPFLEDTLFNYIKTLNKEILIPNLNLKGILKGLASDLLPNEILNKPKTGFSIPIDNWLITNWREIFEELVLEKKQNLIDLNYDYIRKIWNDQLDGKSNGHKLYAVLVFHIWVRNYFIK
ncbi:MAG: asparagine synthase (glutamine-hydrolyzing) [Flavobacteriales bacterium]|nr:asparagine synthase (glutamine-hydrolyzing) [Flavobacteriales bacterium]|tara:strand:- start:14631 stop:16487 length:1857 start_codon:yes stop_codon:yes gene_type:complete